MKMTIFTIGHSTHPIKVFIKILLSFGIKQVVEVRTIPRSRHNPQFNEDALNEALSAYSIRYTRNVGLDGLIHTSNNSINKAWKNAPFHGFADHMQTVEFKTSTDELIYLAK